MGRYLVFDVGCIGAASRPAWSACTPTPSELGLTREDPLLAYAGRSTPVSAGPTCSRCCPPTRPTLGGDAA